MQKNEPHPATRGAREIFARWVLDQGGGKLRPYQLAAGSPSSTWLVGAELASLSRVGFLERAHRVRRGEGGWEGRGGPLWSPAVPLCDVHPPCRQPYRATRATIKAHSTHPHRPRPYGSGSFVGGSPQKNLPVKGSPGSPSSVDRCFTNCWSQCPASARPFFP